MHYPCAAGLARLGLTGYPGLKFMHLPVMKWFQQRGRVRLQYRRGLTIKMNMLD